jgi:hypothetical protein
VSDQAPSETDAEYVAVFHQSVRESRKFLAEFRATRIAGPRDPDELQARMMRRSGRPTLDHYARVFRAEGMPADAAQREARRMVAADGELLGRYPAS